MVKMRKALSSRIKQLKPFLGNMQAESKEKKS
jgi:hypothetical protein